MDALESYYNATSILQCMLNMLQSYQYVNPPWGLAHLLLAHVLLQRRNQAGADQVDANGSRAGLHVRRRAALPHRVEGGRAAVLLDRLVVASGRGAGGRIVHAPRGGPQQRGRRGALQGGRHDRRGHAVGGAGQSVRKRAAESRAVRQRPGPRVVGQVPACRLKRSQGSQSLASQARLSAAGGVRIPRQVTQLMPNVNGFV